MSDYLYFLSYARYDREDDKYNCIRNFSKELEQEVRMLTGVQGNVGFFDHHDIEPRDVWPDTIAEALCTCRVFVPIYSPTYFATDYCGREWTIFRDRLEAYKAQNPGTRVESLIQPVLLVPPDSLRALPDSVSDIQYIYDQDPEYYRTEGLHVIFRVGAFRDSYVMFINALAKRIVEVAEEHPLPPLDPPPDIEQTKSAFHYPGTQIPVRNNVSETVGPRYVQFIFVVGERRELQRIRDNLDYYGEDSLSWRPFLPAVTDEVGTLSQKIAAKERLLYRTILLDDDIVQKLKEAEQNATIVVIIVDAWTLHLEQYRTLMRSVDEYDFLNCAVLILWNPQDDETLSSRSVLENAIQATFPRKWVAGDSDRFLPSINSLGEFERQLTESLQKVRILLMERSSFPKTEPRPWWRWPFGRQESTEAIEERVEHFQSELRSQVRARSYGARRNLIEAPLRELALDTAPRVGWARDPRLIEPEPLSERNADDVAAAFESSKKRLLIVGEPGSGKTMAAYSLIEYLDEREGDERIPLLVNLSAWEAQEDFETFLVDYLCSPVGYEVRERALAIAFIRSRRYNLILDGLDEIPAGLRQHFSERLDEFVRGLPGEVGVVVTCRTQEYEQLLASHFTGLALVQAVEILPLSTEQLDSAFVELASRDKDWELLLSQRDLTASQRVRHVLSNPLFLNLAVVGHVSPIQLLDWTSTEQELRDLILERSLERGQIHEHELRDPVLGRSLDRSYNVWFVNLVPDPSTQLRVGQTFTLSLQLTTDETLESTPLRVPVTALELNVFVEAPGYQLDGESQRTLQVVKGWPEKTSLAFSLTTRASGTHMITVRVYAGGQAAGAEPVELTCPVQVVSPEPLPSIRELVDRQAIPQPQPDVTLYVVLEETPDGEQLRYFVTCPVLGIDRKRLDPPLPLTAADLAGLRYGALRAADDADMTAPPTHTRVALEAYGKFLYGRLVPPDHPLQRLYFDLLERQRATPWSWLVVSDERASLPWEWVLPYGFSEDVQSGTVTPWQDIFWAEKFILSHWIGNQGLTLMGEAPLGQLDVTHYNQRPQQMPRWQVALGGQDLVHLEEQVGRPTLTQPGARFYGLHVVRYSESRQADQITEAADQATVGGVQEQPVQSMIGGEQLDFSLRRPIVGLSFVDGQVENSGSRLADTDTQLEAGWLMPFIRAGATALVGPRWPVLPAADQLFFRVFYTLIRTNIPLGEAVQAARAEVRAAFQARTDWLAYVYFGHPRCEPYQVRPAQGYTLFEAIGHPEDAPFVAGKQYHFRATYRTEPPIWYSGRVRLPPSEIPGDDLMVIVIPMTGERPTTYRLERLPNSADHQCLIPLTMPEYSMTLPVIVRFQQGRRELQTLSVDLDVVEERS